MSIAETTKELAEDADNQVFFPSDPDGKWEFDGNCVEYSKQCAVYRHYDITEQDPEKKFKYYVSPYSRVQCYICGGIGKCYTESLIDGKSRWVGCTKCDATGFLGLYKNEF